MKLLIVTPYFLPKIGGLENYAYNFALTLHKKYKWDVVVITSNHKSKTDTKEKIQGMTVYRLAPLLKVSNTPINPFWYFKIKSILKREKPTVINAHTPVPFISDITALVCGKIPYVVTYHAYSLYKNSFTPLNIIIRIYKWLEAFQFYKAKRIIVVSDPIKYILPKELRKKTVVIYNSISGKELLISKKQTKKSLVFIGGLDKTHRWKGLDKILAALKILGDKYTLSVIGDGDYKKYYEGVVEKLGLSRQVFFYGKRTGLLKRTILKKSAIGIIYPTSANDAFPTVALEYWANKIQIVASDSIPLNKVLHDKKNALLIKPNKPYLLAEAIEHVSSNKKLQSALVKNGFNEVKNKYLLENTVNKYKSILLQTL